MKKPDSVEVSFDSEGGFLGPSMDIPVSWAEAVPEGFEKYDTVHVPSVKLDAFVGCKIVAVGNPSHEEFSLSRPQRAFVIKEVDFGWGETTYQLEVLDGPRKDLLPIGPECSTNGTICSFHDYWEAANDWRARCRWYGDELTRLPGKCARCLAHYNNLLEVRKPKK